MGETISGIYERNDIALRTQEKLPEYKGWYRSDDIPVPESAVTEICENSVYEYHTASGKHACDCTCPRRFIPE